MSDEYFEAKTPVVASKKSRPSSGRRSQASTTHSPSLPVTCSSNQELQVYIPDIPTDLLENDLEELIKLRIEKTQRFPIRRVQCYLNLGIAVIYLINEEEKVHLINDVQSMVLDPKTNKNISFISEIELDSYVVVDRNISKVPSADDVAGIYMKSYKKNEPPPCKSISGHFPNIFRIFFSTLDELAKAANTPDFKVGTVFATIYPRVECSFLEDLPPNTNDAKISSAIAAQIEEEKLSFPSFYVQYDKETNNAIVLATKSNKKWATQSFIKISGQNVSKKIKLAYRVTVSPVPPGFDLNLILNHRLFESRVVRHSHIRDYLIVELNNMSHYNECIDIGAVRIKGHPAMNITPHGITSDPDSSELDDNNWYDTEMNDIKPDIVPLMTNHQHPIFRYKWNAECWLQQMKKAEAADPRPSRYDLGRHLLRVTVMLNTIGVLRKKKYVVDGIEVTLKLQRLQTILYDHKSKLIQGKTISQSELKTPHTSTSVIVSNEDCLVLYEKLVREGRRPLLLNMASATSPGGGYRKGDGAQEENLFRRSDYYQSLDIEIADKDRSERFYCTEKYEIKRPAGYFTLYPMVEFGAIYTSGITVFRGTEATGYPHMKEPLYNVCSIAMAAYREPILTKNNMLDKKYAANTHKKIQNIFAIAHHHKHDCLVLSAIGCGAFKNPPDHVARLFKSVIYQYAGYFEKIYFAIIDDHNTGGRINPRGNFAPFKEILDGLVVHPPKTFETNGVSGPYRILTKSSDGKITLSDSCIFNAPPCQHATQCREINDTQHSNNFSHPPICLYQHSTSECDQIDDEVHLFTFIHRKKCKYGGECIITDPNHYNEFDHPAFCKEKSNCINVSPEHLYAYRHLPVCPLGISCPEYRKKVVDHLNAFRHCKTVCPHDNCCPNFHDSEHIKTTIHSFQEPCPFTPYNCSMFVQYIHAGGKKVPDNVENHCLAYSHVCQFGRLCRTTDAAHFSTSIHIARCVCPYLDKCSKTNDESHLESFSHPGIRDIRLFCRNPGYMCPNRFEEKHLKMYRHAKDYNQLSVASCMNLNAAIDFFHNQGNIIKVVNNYVDASGWKKAKISKDILDWIRALQPVHRCGPEIFASILVHGHVMSRDHMNNLTKPRCVVNAVMQHNKICEIFRRHHGPAVKQNTKELIKLLVKREFIKAGYTGGPPLDSDHDQQISIIKKKLKPPMDEHDFQIIEDWTVKIVVASIHLSTHLAGIGFDVDKKMGTDKSVFSILGPHCGTYYGDIVITFKQAIMFHPDANVSFQAATGFHSARIYTFRPWWKDPNDEGQRIQHFHNSKLHCSYPRYEYAAASELVAATGKSGKTMDVDLDSVITQWKRVDSHFVFEGHLPAVIPLDYIENVYMPKNLFQSLPNESQLLAREIFKKSLILAEYDVNLSLIKPGTTVPLDDTRKPYLQYILDKLCDNINRRIKNPYISRGFVVTIPGTNFSNHIVLPMTITQSYKLHCLNKSQPVGNMESTYIYWQAMDGDMMLTVTNEKIDPDGKDQHNLQCLVCYVANKPSTSTDEYHEECSYLNIGSPYHHANNVNEGKFKAKSSRFYRGCNTDDFFTFCLKINYRTGDVSLTHAGSNGIYNHENIHYEFKKSELDLHKLNFVHISAGNQNVPIQNMMIHHEPVEKLHPKFDRDFKNDTSTLIRDRRASFHYFDSSCVGEREEETAIGPAVPPRGMRKAASTADLAAKLAESLPKEMPKKPQRGFFSRLKYLFLGTTKSDDPPTSASPPPQSPKNAKPKPDSSEGKKPKSYSSGSKPVIASSPAPLMSSTLPPCRDSIYCLMQKDQDHIDNYSHPCRFNDLCKRKSTEPHLVHNQHDMPRCLEDKMCSALSNPIHRSEYRHSGLPDYLIPCQYQEACYTKDPNHRIRFFHGEEIPSIKKPNPLSSHGAAVLKGALTPCKYGNGCKYMKDPQHTAQYSHPLF